MSQNIRSRYRTSSVPKDNFSKKPVFYYFSDHENKVSKEVLY